jgi:hypothetical protein
MSPRSKARKSRGRRPGARIPVRAARDASDVCLRCGLCCDGTLFPTATLRDDEVEFAASLGLTTLHRDDGFYAWAQPCPKFVDGCCSTYAERPDVCGKYRCALLPMYEAGDADLDDCLDIVELVRGYARDLEHAMGAPAGSYSATALSRFLEDTRPNDDPAAHQATLVPLFRLTQLGTRYFGWTGVPRVPEEAVDTAHGRFAPSRTVDVPVDPPVDDAPPG